MMGDKIALENDLASVVRVRNRLAQSKNEALPKILAGLLPRLLTRLEKNAVALYESDPSTVPIRNQIQTQILGIISHAMERVRGDPFLMVPLDAIIQTEQPKKSRVARTMTLALIQLGLLRCEEPLSLLMMTMWSNVDSLFRSVVGDPTSTSTFNDWKTASWLCLDAISILANMKPMQDFDLVDFDPHSYEEPDKEKLVATPDVVRAVSMDGVGVFDLMLDIFLYQVEDFPSVFGGSSIGISEKGVSRIMHRQGQGQRWNENARAFMKELKYACFRYTVWPFEKGLFLGPKGSVGTNRSLILIVLMATKNSKVGRLAADGLNKSLGRQRLEKQGNQFVSRKAVLCDLSMAVSMLILVLGDEAAHPVLEKHQGLKHLWEAVIGPRSTDPSLQRTPLPPAMAARAVDFVGSQFSIAREPRKEGLALFVDLTVAVQNYQGLAGFGAIHLIHSLFKDLKGSGVSEDDEWARIFQKQCIEAATAVLRTVSNPHAPRNQFIPAPRQAEGDDLEGEEGFPPNAAAAFQNQFRGAVRNNMLQALGRPDRADMDRLIVRHRQSQFKKNLNLEAATNAREAAYDLITNLAHQIPVSTPEGEMSLEIPVLLFGCATTEDEAMQVHVSRALGTMLKYYRSFLSTGSDYMQFEDEAILQSKASRLLPSLLETACSESPAVRLAALNWVDGLLQPLDTQAAFHICSSLVGDEDTMVSKLAKKLVRAFQKDPTNLPTTKEVEIFQFVDSSSESSLQPIYDSIQDSIGKIVHETGVLADSATIILRDFSFKMNDAIVALGSEREETISKCGVTCHCAEQGKNSELQPMDLTCGICSICYDDEVPQEDLFAMPCSHQFCLGCWQSYVENKGEDGSNLLLSATCPFQGCKERLTLKEIRRLAPSMVEKWNQNMLEDFVKKDPHHACCPGPDCNMIVISETGRGNVECCQCQTNFCFACREQPHVPAGCDDVQRWNKSFQDSKFWIKKNTRNCPGCNAPIEKNSGCNHMTCSQCSFEFCWLCLAPLDSHLAPHECNRYDPAENGDGDQFERDMFFTERFQGHEQAEFFAKKHLEDADTAIQKLVDRIWYLEEEDTDTLLDARRILVVSRQFLKYSYVAAYSMQDEKRARKVFEHQQGALEAFVEKLSALSETSPEGIYLDGGGVGYRKHLKSLSFYTTSVKKYMERIVACAEHLR